MIAHQGWFDEAAQAVVEGLGGPVVQVLVAYVWCEMVWTQKSTELPQVDEFLEFVSVCGITNIPQMGPASRESCWLYSGLRRSVVQWGLCERPSRS